MKKSILYLSVIVFAVSGCQTEFEPDRSYMDNVSDVTFTAENESGRPEARAALIPDGQDADIYNVHWSSTDRVYVTDGSISAVYNAEPDADDPTKAVLTTSLEMTPSQDAEAYYAICPADDKSFAGEQGYTVNIPSVQKWTKDGNMQIPRIGFAGPDRKLLFRNVVSLLKITPNNLCDSYDGVKVSRIEVISDVENIAGVTEFSYDGESAPVIVSKEKGTRKIVLECEGGASFDQTFFIAVLPGTYVGGLSINIISNGGGSQSFVIPAEKEYVRSKYAAVRCKVNNLAIYEPANCYLIKQAGTYKFPVNVRGNGRAEILKRESSNSATYVTYNYRQVSIDPSSISSTSTTVISQQDKTVSEHDSALTVTDVQLRDGYIHFTVPEGFTPGNIRVGIHGEDTGKYIWSWHIWVNCQVEDLDMGKMHNNLDYGTKIMNMNLGSLQTKENLAGYAGGNSGLYYQWGRKDPFPPMNGSDVTLPDGYTVDAHCNGATATHHRSKVENAINYPADFYSGNEVGKQVRTWCDESLYHHWAATPASGSTAAMATYNYEKSMFDPCPPGYRILDPFTVKTIAYTGNTKTYFMTNYDDLGYMQTKRGEKPVFPYDGCRTPGTPTAYDTAGDLADAGTAPYYWVASTWNKDNQNACILRITGVTVDDVTHQYANIQKYVKAYAASIRPMRDYER